MFGPPTLHWGWTEACNHTIGGDETCELFMASEMFHDERTFVEIADRSSSKRRVSLGRLKRHIAEAVVEEGPLSLLVLGACVRAASVFVGPGCLDDVWFRLSCEEAKVDRCVAEFVELQGEPFEELERVDAFYRSLKELQIPMLSYPDIACRLPSLNRTSRSTSGAAFYHSYVDLPVNKTPIHFGCGVHLILAHAVHLYLKKLLQDSCGSKSEECTGRLQEICSAGFRSVQEKSRLETHVVAELSPDQKCEVTPLTSIRCDQIDGCNFPALVSNSSKWKLGGERKWALKPGWVANAELKWVWPVQSDLFDAAVYNLSAKLPATDILFPLRLFVGTVFLDYMATYENIGSVTCGLEDLKGRTIGPSFEVDALWSRRVSLAERVKISASQVPELPPEEPNAVLRCREEGQKFKIFGVTSC
eukprot:Skav231858  [mRNA]  locus=scaffold2307:159157:160678:+ [translate_table: standard]